MKISMFRLTAVYIMTALSVQAQIAGWIPKGIGGGGSLFSPSINPLQTGEFYAVCDMGEMFHTGDFGGNFATVNFRQMRPSHYSRVCYTHDDRIRYALNGYQIIKTTNGGAEWAPISGALRWEDTYQLYVDYYHPERMVSSVWGNIKYSPDGGDSYRIIHQASSNATGIILGGVFFDGDNIYIGCNDGILISKDAGVSFSIMPVTGIPSGQRIFSFAGARENGHICFYCITSSAEQYWGVPSNLDYYGFTKGVYKMSDLSGQWQSCLNGIDLNNDFPQWVSMAENDISTVYLAGGCSSFAPLVLVTTDGGNNWTHSFRTDNNDNVFTGWSGSGGDKSWGFGERVYGIDVARFNSGIAVITDMGFIHKTKDKGLTWHQSYVDASFENPSGAATPRKKYYKGNGLENTSCWQVFWPDKDHIFAAFTDISGIRSTDRGQTWSFDYSGHTDNTMYWITQNAQSGILYAATSTVHDIYQSTYLNDARIDNGGGKVLYSTDLGANWQILHDFKHPVYYVAADPSIHSRLYASVVNSSEGGIYYSDNIQLGNASTWTKLPNPPRTEGHPASIAVLNDGSLVCSFSGRRGADGKFTASSGVFIYSFISGQWTDVSDEGMKYWSRDVIVDKNDPAQNTWYACVYSGWGGTGNDMGGLYKTVNRGQSWSRIFGPDNVSSCAINPGYPDNLHLATEENGLWYSTNINSTSPEFHEEVDYPFAHPERIFFNPYKENEIWVTSFGNGIMSTVEKPLPVELQSFTTEIKNKTVTLNWVTATEINNLGFEIQRGTDESNMKKIGFATGSGYSVRPVVYSYVDETLPAPGSYLYRLKQIDFGGSCVYSDIRKVSYSLPEDIQLMQNYPNPFNPSTDIRFSIPDDGYAKLSIYNPIGEEIAVLLSCNLQAGEHTYKLDSNRYRLSAGVYFYVLQTSGKIKAMQMCLVK